MIHDEQLTIHTNLLRTSERCTKDIFNTSQQAVPTNSSLRGGNEMDDEAIYNNYSGRDVK
jgi:hypothetical protein